jgi:ribosomal protection tetracycline resistance protein
LLNLGILAHVDAGKTSLTERLLFTAGLIDEIGRVDDGDTQTDTLALERRRGITIRSAVVSFPIGDVTVTLIDTPGHPDFIAEVERVLGVLDGAVLVVSAVEGVQAQTRILLRALRRLRIPTLIFVNKIDRTGAAEATVLAGLAERLTPDLVAMNRVTAAGTRAAAVRAVDVPVEALAEHDDGVLAAYLADRPVDVGREMAARVAAGRIHPVFFGSAITGAGVDALRAGIAALLPPAAGDPDRPVAATVFKVERGPAGERIAYLRMFDGSLRVRDRVGDATVTGIALFTGGEREARPSVSAGQIATVRGLPGIRIGDPIGARRDEPVTAARFAPPTLETVVVPARRRDTGALHAALAQLVEQDPLIAPRVDDEIKLSLYGEVQKEVIQATLAEEYGLAVTFRPSTTLCVERPAGTGESVDVLKTPANPFLATVGLRVEPGPVGSGVRFGLGVEPGAMPIAFFRAVRETVHEAARQGPRGWPVVDMLVTMTRSGYCPRSSHGHQAFDKNLSSTAGDFRNLTPLVLMDALRAAGTRVYEPIHAFRVDLPADTVAAVLPALGRVGGVPLVTGTDRVEGDLPAAAVHRMRTLLPGLTRGEGVLESAFDRYEPVRGPVPERPRTDLNPTDRKDYLIRVRQAAVPCGHGS